MLVRGGTIVAACSTVGRPETGDETFDGFVLVVAGAEEVGVEVLAVLVVDPGLRLLTPGWKRLCGFLTCDDCPSNERR